jgi:hypothetical protein
VQELITRIVLDLPKTKSVEAVQNDDTKRLLRLRISSEGRWPRTYYRRRTQSSVMLISDQLPPAARDVLEGAGASIIPDVVKLDYDHWTAGMWDVIRLPVDFGVNDERD